MATLLRRCALAAGRQSRRPLSDAGGGMSPSEYCSNVVRTADANFHRCALLMDTEMRRCALAAGAFGVEISQIRDAASDAKLARLRMRYWRDCLDIIYSEDGRIHSNEYPVVRELDKVVRAHQLPRHLLEKMLVARERYVGGGTFRDFAELERYCEAAFSSLLRLLLLSAGLAKIEHKQAFTAASHAGRAIGLGRFLCSVPLLLRAGRCELPTDMLRQFQVSASDLARCRPSPELASLVQEIAGALEAHVECCRQLLPQVPESAGLAFLPLVDLPPLLARARAVQFDLFRLPQLPAAPAWQLLLAKWRRSVL